MPKDPPDRFSEVRALTGSKKCTYNDKGKMGEHMKKQRTGQPVISGKMAALRYGNIRLVLGLLLLLFGLSGSLACFFLYVAAKNDYEESQNYGVVFDSSRPQGYSKISLQYLTGSFAEHIKTGDQFYFGFDYMFKPYVISVKGGLSPELLALMDYTSGSGEEAHPGAVTVYGYGKPLIPELLGYARESYSLMWEESQIPITMEELSGIVGDYYLDITPQSFEKRYPWSAALYIAPEALLLAGAVLLARFLRDDGHQWKQLAERAKEVEAADRELAHTEEYAAGLKLYLTEHFIISGAYRLEVVPYEAVISVERSGNYVIAVTEDQCAHILAGGKKCGALGTAMIEEIQRRVRNCQRLQTKGENHAIISCN